MLAGPQAAVAGAPQGEKVLSAVGASLPFARPEPYAPSFTPAASMIASPTAPAVPAAAPSPALELAPPGTAKRTAQLAAYIQSTPPNTGVVLQQPYGFNPMLTPATAVSQYRTETRGYLRGGPPRVLDPPAVPQGSTWVRYPVPPPPSLDPPPLGAVLGIPASTMFFGR